MKKIVVGILIIMMLLIYVTATWFSQFGIPIDIATGDVNGIVTGKLIIIVSSLSLAIIYGILEKFL